MGFSDWINPSNWNQETKEAAHAALKMTVIFVIALVQANYGGKSVAETSVPKITGR